MSIVDVLEVKYVSENPSAFDAPLRFEVTFECLDSLEDDLEWKIVYVGSAEDQGRDQVLEEVMVGPVPLGTSKFVLEAPPPSFAAIPRGDRLGVTVVSITCAYLDQPFVSVGYYVNNEYFAPGAGPREGGAAVPPEDAPPEFGAERGGKRPVSARVG
jgi:histone chaperone ASF1